MTLRHVVTYRNTDGRIFSQHLSLAESSQIIPSPHVGYALWDVSTYSSGFLIDDRLFKIDAVSSVRAFCCPISTDYGIWNAPTYPQCAALIFSEINRTDPTQLSDSSLAGTTMQASWSTYRSQLRAFTSTMTGNYILDNWPTVPDGSSVTQMLIAMTTAPLYTRDLRLPVDAAQFGYVGGQDANQRMLAGAGSFALYGYDARPIVDRHGITGDYGFRGPPVTISRTVKHDPGYISWHGSSIDGTGEFFQMRGVVAGEPFSGSSVGLSVGRGLVAQPAYYQTAGKYVSAESTIPRPSYGVTPDSGQFRYTVRGYHGDLYTRGLTPAAAYLFVTPTFRST